MLPLFLPSIDHAESVCRRVPATRGSSQSSRTSVFARRRSGASKIPWVIYELKINKRSDIVYEWTLVRLPKKIGEGSEPDMPAVVLAPFRGRLVKPGDWLAITLNGNAAGIYSVPVFADEASRVSRGIAAIATS